MTQEQFSAMAVEALRALADAIESGACIARSICHRADSLSVDFERSPLVERPIQVKADPNRPCDHTSRPVTAGGDELACPDCGEVWTP